MAATFLNTLCVAIAFACVVIMWRFGKSFRYPVPGTPLQPSSRLDSLLGFVGFGGVLLGIVAAGLSIPTRSRPTFLPILPFALPLLTVGLVCWSILVVREALSRSRAARRSEGPVRD